MKVPVLVFSALLLAACRPQQAAPVTEATAPKTPDAAVETTPDAPPADELFAASFDCAKAASDIERMICADPELAALDKRMADTYETELNRPDTVKPAMAATQLGWKKGRDECWQGEGNRRCVLESYWTRLAELQMDSPDTMQPEAVAFDCNDDSQPVSAAFYSQLDPMSVVLTVGKDRAILFSEPSASGSKYGRHGASFWEHQGEAAIEFYGKKLKCKPAGKAG